MFLLVLPELPNEQCQIFLEHGFMDSTEFLMFVFKLVINHSDAVTLRNQEETLILVTISCLLHCLCVRAYLSVGLEQIHVAVRVSDDL
jgi:hypothetical protein